VPFESSSSIAALGIKVFGGIRVSQASTQRGRAATKSRFLAPLCFALNDMSFRVLHGPAAHP